MTSKTLKLTPVGRPLGGSFINLTGGSLVKSRSRLASMYKRSYFGTAGLRNRPGVPGIRASAIRLTAAEGLALDLAGSFSADFSVADGCAASAAGGFSSDWSLKEQVLRDGREVTLLGLDLVPGDVVLLAAGDLVPADGRLLEARDFFVNEALLTGESYPAEKHARDAGVDSVEVAEALASRRSRAASSAP